MVINPLSYFNGNRINYVDQIRNLTLHANVDEYNVINTHVSDYIIEMIPKFNCDHNDLVAKFQNYEFDNDDVNFEYLLDNIRKIYTVKDLIKQLKYSGMTKIEIDMVLASIYETCFTTTITGRGYMYIQLYFRETNKVYASSVMTLCWRDGFFFTQV